MRSFFLFASRRAGRRLRRAEATFFDAYMRGGVRANVPLVIPLGYFDAPAVRGHVLGWLAGDHALDTRFLLAEWSRGRRAGEAEASFFENLATFVSIAYDARPYGARTRRGWVGFVDARSREFQ